jgi:hypothetical protein
VPNKVGVGVCVFNFFLDFHRFSIVGKDDLNVFPIFQCVS